MSEDELEYEGPEEYEKRSHENNLVGLGNGLERSYQACERVFASEIQQTVSRFNSLTASRGNNASRMERRQFVPSSLAFLAGLYTSNIVETVKEKLVGQSSLEQRLNFVASSVSQLNAKYDLTVLARKALAHSLGDLKQQLQKVQHVLTRRSKVYE